MINRKWSEIGVWSAVVVGAIIRLIGIGKLSFWFDEGYTAWAINHSPLQIIRIIANDTASPLYYLLLWGWSHIFGHSEAALRGMSAFFGILSIPLVAGIARRLAGEAAAVAAAWIFALSWWQFAYCQEARGYELSVFLMTAMFYTDLRYLQKPTRGGEALAIFTGVAALYTNNFMILYILAMGVAIFLMPSPRSFDRRFRFARVAALWLAITYLPWLGVLLSQIHRVNGDFWIAAPTVSDIFQELSRMWGVEHFWTWDQYIHSVFHDTAGGVPRTAAILLVAGMAAAWFLLKFDQRRAARALIVAAILPPAMAIAYSLVRRPIFLPAGFLPSSAMCSIFIGCTVGWSRKWPARLLVVGVMILSAANLWAFQVERTKEDWRSAGAAVTAMPMANHRMIVFAAPEAQLPFDYYYSPRSGELQTGAPGAFFSQIPLRTENRVMKDGDLDYLRGQLAEMKPDDVILVISHAGWPDTQGVWHSEYSDPDGLTAKYFLSTMQVAQRVDFPDDSSKHQITIWRLLPR